MANNVFQVKRTSTSGRTPNTTGSYATNSQYIAAGEFALNMADGILYSSNGSAVIEIGANNTTSRVTNALILDNDKRIYFRTKNTAANAMFVQQVDDNFVFYSTNTSYQARPVWSIYANSDTSNLSILVPTVFNSTAYLGAVSANGTVGSSGQVFTSNGSATYWSSPGAASVNTAAQYTWTNTQTFSANISFTGNGIGIATNTGAIYLGGISDVNWRIGRNTGATTKWQYTNNTIDIITANSNLEGMTIGLINGNSYFETGYLGTFIASNVTIGNTSSNSTINSTAFSGTANNATNLGGVAASGYQTTAGLAANVATLTANNANFVKANNGITSNTLGVFVTQGTGVVVNATGVHVNAAYINTIAANSATFVLANNGIISNSTGVFVNGNTGIVVNSTGVFVNATYIGTISSNNASFLGGTAAASYQLNSTLNANIASYLPTYNGVVNASSFNAGATGTGTGGSVQNTTTMFVGNNTINTSISAGAITINGTAVIANNSGLFTTGTVNAASHTTGATGTGAGGISANVTTLWIGNNTINTTITSAGLVVNGTAVIANNSGVWTTGTVNAASHTTGATGTGTGGAVVNTTVFFLGNNTINAAVNTTSLYIGGNVIANSTGANNAFNLGGVAAASYVNTSGAYTITGIHTHTANLVVNAAIIAGGTSGSAGQVLTSNGTGNVYWSTVTSGGVNTAASYTWTNVQIFTANVTVNGAIIAGGNSGTAGQLLASNGTGNVYWTDAPVSNAVYMKGGAAAIGTLAAGGSNLFRVNGNTLNYNTTFVAGENASATGPIAVASGITLTVESGARVAIV